MSEISTTGNDGENGSVAVQRPYEKFLEYLGHRADVDGANNTFDVAAGMMDKIFNASTAEEIWDADEGGLLAGQNLKDVEQEIKGFKVLRSNRADFDNGMGVYIIVDATRLDTGEDIVWNTGAPGLIAKLRAFEAMNLLPIRGVIRGQLAGNGEVLKLRPIPSRAVASTATE